MSSVLPATNRARRTRRRGTDSQTFLSSLPWIGPALLLILAIVVFPAGYMIYNSTRKISSVGTDLESAGLENFVTIFQDPVLPRVLLNTVLWVVSVVVITVLLSLVLAQFLNKPFPGRTIVRMAVIVPWAASVVMTTTVFYYGLDPNYGIFNHFFVQLGLMDEGYGWTKNAVPAIAVSVVVAIFVSIPFTTYTLLAGLQAIPQETLEAARVDGAGRWKTYLLVIIPQLRSALAVSMLINIINVFNNLPILKVMTGSIPGNSADTLMTYIFKVLQFDRRLDLSSALSVVNFAIVLVIVAIYVKTVKPMQEI
ncbi:carbohydrate ABC transporter permease [Micrococcus antarcticus]|uniref:carbohydrate ABC transporter permease n=1 Tax=unclassified Arthrobacter TaxID=235627 RepID=UPI000CFD7FB6|nr:MULTISPECIES: sugar ABC transporter permease [unclassified Arthrobacter]PQZ88294.1 sugar ABC transporter permease [Arthrobacter sp. MYb222]PRB76836.1 sugar ABC transporter permease [Arthrobacter sp. MYb214]TDU30286.1 carbohydrate ABC transporter membrane protein 1 (CUT1 family) [Arthrobacter sp. JUb115]